MRGAWNDVVNHRPGGAAYAELALDLLNAQERARNDG
jgi:hypothetical protein